MMLNFKNIPLDYCGGRQLDVDTYVQEGFVISNRRLFGERIDQTKSYIRLLIAFCAGEILDPNYFNGKSFPVPQRLAWVISHGDDRNGFWEFADLPYGSVQDAVYTLDQRGYDGIVLQVCNPGRYDVISDRTPVFYIKGILAPQTVSHMYDFEKAIYVPHSLC